MNRCTWIFAILLTVAGLLLPVVPSPADYLGKSAAQWQAELASKDLKVKRGAAFALGKLGAQALGSVPALTTCLQNDKDAGVRETAAYALGQILPRGRAAPGVVKLLLAHLAADADPRVKRSAAVALGHCADDSAEVRVALEKALNDADAGVRQNAVWALGELCQQSETAPIDSFRKALKDSDKLIKRDAALALGKIITYQATDNENADARERHRVAAVRELAQPAVADLLACVKHDYLELRKAACGTLADLVHAKHTEAIPILAQACKDEDLEVKRNAALALASIGGKGTEPAIPVLQEALRNGDIEVKRLAALAFRNLGPAAKGALPDLRKALTHADDELRYSAALGMGGLKKEAAPAVPDLVRRVTDDKEKLNVRVASAMALQVIGACDEATDAVGSLVKILDDPKQPPRVRERVLWALRVHGNDLTNYEDVFTAMKKILTEPGLGESGGRSGKMLRYDSAFLLGVFKQSQTPDEVFPVLLSFLKDTTIRIYTGLQGPTGGVKEGSSSKGNVSEQGGEDGRKMAIQALKRIGAGRVKSHPEILAQVRSLRDDPEIQAKLREAAGDLLKEFGVK
jgi:HEAT repeat protein